MLAKQFRLNSMKIGQWKHRLGQMKRDEILDRVRQAIRKRSDAGLAGLGFDFASSGLISTSTAPSSFFFAPESIDSILDLIRLRLPGRVEQIIQEANQICTHQFDLLGYTGLDYRNPKDASVDWHRDAVHGKRAPRKIFYRVPYLDYDECGDSKVIWELNRHQHLVTLAKAYRLTQDRLYLDELLFQRRHWISENPYPMGINWASSLEVAFRTLSWLWVYQLLCGSPGVPEIRSEWLRGLALHGRHIEQYLSTYFSPNTHLLGEAVGLFFLGVLCPEIAAAQRWRSLGWKLILQESEHQIRADGFHFEQSTYYHVYALDLLLHASVLASFNSIPLPEKLQNTIEKMLTALCLLGRHGPPPRFGDDDGGRLFDPRRNLGEHLLDPLATGAILFHRGDFKAAAGGLREETLWLLGEEGVRQWDRLQSISVEAESSELPEAGYYMLTAQDSQLIVDAGPLGALTGGHAHADALSICLQTGGHSLLIDPGTMEYVGPATDRDLFRSTAMHNTVRVDGLEQAVPATTFSWKKLTKSKVEQWIQGHGFDLFTASHDGYETLEHPVTHRRCVVSLKNGMYLVRDIVQGFGMHRVDISWHLEQDLERIGERVFQVKGTSCGLALIPAGEEDWSEELSQNAWSPAYGQKAPMSVLNFSARVELPAEFAVLLVAFDVGCQTDEFLGRRADTVAELRAYEYAVNGQRYSFAFCDRGGIWQNGSLSSDARFVCHEVSPVDRERLILCGGTYAKVDGGPELCSTRSIDWAEFVAERGLSNVFSSDLSAIIEDPSAEPISDPASVLSRRT